jgi:outer membrane protein
MKKWLLAGVCAGLMVANVAQGEDIKIGFVDVRQVVVESAAGKQHRAEMEKAVKEKRAALDEEQKKLQALKEGYEKDALTYTDAQKRSKQRDLEDKFQALQDKAAQADKELTQRDGEFTNKAVAEIKELIAVVAKEEKVGMVFAKSDLVLFTANSVDLTPKVLQKYDTKPAKK